MQAQQEQEDGSGQGGFLILVHFNGWLIKNGWPCFRAHQGQELDKHPHRKPRCDFVFNIHTLFYYHSIDYQLNIQIDFFEPEFIRFMNKGYSITANLV
jgi:hypothetical protein